MKHQDIQRIFEILYIDKTMKRLMQQLADVEGVRMIMIMSNRGIPLAEYYQGILYWNGIAVEQDNKKAMEYFNKALLHCNKEIENNIKKLLN